MVTIYFSHKAEINFLKRGAVMLKKMLTFLNEAIEKPLFTENEPSIWNELDNDLYEEEIEEKHKLL